MAPLLETALQNHEEDCATKDAVSDPESYHEFYEELGKSYPETSLVHADRGVGSRYWTVMKELRAFARKGRTMLDIGCNDGVYTIPYCSAGGKALGVDISPSLVKKARDEAARLGVGCRFMAADIESPDAPHIIGEQFDLVLMSEVLEHLRDPSAALKNVRDLVRHRGHFMVTCPTPILEDIVPFDLRYIGDVVRGKKLLERHVIDTRNVSVFRQYGVSGYLYRHDAYYPKALQRYMEGFGFKTVKFSTVGIPAPLRALRRTMARGSPLKKYLAEGVPQPPSEPAPMTFPRRIWGAVKSSNRYFESLERRLPVIRLLGANCVGIFRRQD